MYKCKDCKAKFEFPEVKNLDAGHGEGILGFPIRNSIKFCPHCMSVNIKVNTGSIMDRYGVMS